MKTKIIKISVLIKNRIIRSNYFRTKSKYGDTGNDRFTFTQALVFVQCIINALLAYILNGSYKDEVPQKTYAFLSLSYLLAMMASNHALQFISYPTQVILC